MPQGPAIKLVDARTKDQLQEKVNDLYPDYRLDDIISARDVEDWGYKIAVMIRKDLKT